MIDQKTLENIEEFIFSVYGKATIKESDIEPIIAFTSQDKKNKGKEVRFSLLEGTGKCGYDVSVSKGEMKKALEYYF